MDLLCSAAGNRPLMIIVVSPGADPEQVRKQLAARGLWSSLHRSQQGRAVFLIDPCSLPLGVADLADIEGIESVAAPASEHPLIDAQTGAVDVRGIAIGGGSPPVLIAGPCSVEAPEQIERLAEQIASLGIPLLRGGAFKPRTSPYSFQGRGAEALRWLAEAARRHHLRVVSEAMSEAAVPVVAEWSDLVQIGSRNMHNFALLRTAAQAGKPVLLKRGMAATLEEWLAAGEYLRLHGCPGVVFCERGVRSFDHQTRNLLDISAVALLAGVRGLPVIVDPSHAAGRRDLVLPLARAALAAGAAGIMIETHDDPGSALSDGPQALAPKELATLARALGAMAGH